MGNNFIEDFIYNIKRDITYKKLLRWKKNNTGLNANAMRKIKHEHLDKAKGMYIRRSIEGSDVFVDVFWYIKRSEHTPHESYIYYRSNWSVVAKVITRVENNELPAQVNAFFDKISERETKS